MAPHTWLLFPTGHATEAKWQVPKQRVEKEVRHPVRQRRADLPPQFTCEYSSVGQRPCEEGSGVCSPEMCTVQSGLQAPFSGVLLSHRFIR